MHCILREAHRNKTAAQRARNDYYLEHSL